MDFELSDDQVALEGLVRVIVEGRFPIERVRRAEESRAVVDRDDWAALGEAGVFALTVAESEGGVGLGLVEAVVVFEELGRGLVPGPLVPSALCAGYVDGAADGTAAVGTLRVPPAGQPVIVEHPEALSALVVEASDGSLTVVRGEALAQALGAADRIERSLDPLTPLARLATVPEGEPFDRPHWARDARLYVGAYCVGMAAACCASAVEHAKGREQFGRPIGSFQAVKHLCADLLVRSEVARSAVQAAAATADDPAVGDPERLAAGAALLAVEAALANAKTSIQVHGGMGFTWEMPTHLYLMRARLLAASLGPATALSRTVADRL